VFSHASQRCIDVVGGEAVSGAGLMFQDCSEAASQHWTVTDGAMRALGMCVQLTGGSTADGAVLELAACNGGPAQRFVLNSSQDLVHTPDRQVHGRTGQPDGERHSAPAVVLLRRCQPEVVDVLSGGQLEGLDGGDFGAAADAAPGHHRRTAGYQVCSADGWTTHAHGRRTIVRLDSTTFKSTPWSDLVREMARSSGLPQDPA
jgi:hypothetical protein